MGDRGTLARRSIHREDRVYVSRVHERYDQEPDADLQQNAPGRDYRRADRNHLRQGSIVEVALSRPGGGQGADNLAGSVTVKSLLEKTAKQGKIIAAICASPAVVLQHHGLLGFRDIKR